MILNYTCLRIIELVLHSGLIGHEICVVDSENKNRAREKKIKMWKNSSNCNTVLSVFTHAKEALNDEEEVEKIWASWIWISTNMYRGNNPRDNL